MIGGIRRDGAWQIAVGDAHIQSDERVIVVRLSQHLEDVQKLFLAWNDLSFPERRVEYDQRRKHFQTAHQHVPG